MFRKLQVTAIALVFLLNVSGILQAHSLATLPDGDYLEPSQPPAEIQGGKQTRSDNATAPRPVTRKTSVNTPTVRRTATNTILPSGPRKQSSSTASGKSKISSPKSKTSPPKKKAASARTRPSSESRLGSKFERDYKKITGKRLVVTSRARTPFKQAVAIDRNARAFGVRYILRVYGYSGAIREILVPFKANRRSPRRAQREMTKVIESQVARGIYISKHLRGLAIDVRSRGRGAARLSILRQIAARMGGSVSVERNHYHISLT